MSDWRNERRALWWLLLALLVLLLLALVALPAWAGSRDRHTTEASLNVYRANPEPAIRHDVREAMDRADVVRLQEVYPGRPVHAVREVLSHRPHWRAAFLGRMEVPILWDVREFRRVGLGDVRRLYPARAPSWPARFLAWVPLQHRATGRVLTVANVHPLPRYCRAGARDDPARRADATQHWRGVVAWTKRQQAQAPRRPVLLGGDFNCRLAERARPWFPGRILEPLYRFDRSNSIDRLVTSRTWRHPIGLRRWATDARSDHRAQFRTLRVR